MTVLYLSFGADDYHLQTAHSIRSLRRTGYDGTVLVHTDSPAWFTSRRRFGKLRFELEAVDAAAIAAQCANGYFYKYKLALLLQKIAVPGARVLLTDSDTLFLKNPQTLLDAIGERQAVWVYENEGMVAEGSRELRAFYAHHAAEFATIWPPAMPIYNSGLVGVGHHDADWLWDAIALCDTLHREGAGINTFEQIALSAALWRAGRKPDIGFDWINHYYIFKSRMLRGLRLFERLGLSADWLTPEKVFFHEIRDGNAYLRSLAGARRHLTIMALRMGLVRFRALAARQRRHAGEARA